MTARGVVVVTGLRWEAQAVARVLARIRRETGPGWIRWDGFGRSGIPVSVIAAGIGARRVEQASGGALATAAVLLSSGCAGGLDADLEAGDLVLADRLVEPSGAVLDCDPTWSAAIRRAAARARVSTREGAVLAGSDLLSTPAMKVRARRESGALAVEMEAAAVAREARRREVGFAMVRTVLDPGTMSLRYALGCVDDLGRPRPGALAKAILTGGRSALSELARLAAARRRCIHSLTAVHRELFAEPFQDAD